METFPLNNLAEKFEVHRSTRSAPPQGGNGPAPDPTLTAMFSHSNEQKHSCPSGKPVLRQVSENIGAGEGNRTLVFSLEGCCSTIELHPR